MSLADDLKADILKNISIGGAADESEKIVNPIILGSRNNLNQILDKSSGLPKIRKDTTKKFNLVLSTPAILSALSPFEIRCCLCKSVIRYPAWYYSVKYAVNHFHYFVCFDGASADKPTVKCYKRG